MPRSFLALVGLLASSSLAYSANPPKIEAFRIQHCYMNFFHVRFEAPESLILPSFGSNDAASLSNLPKLVCDRTQPVHLLLHGVYSPLTGNLAFKPGPLEFVGIWPEGALPPNGREDSEIECRLIYPIAGKNKKLSEKNRFENCEWVEHTVVLKWKDAAKSWSVPVNRKNPIPYAAIMDLWAGAMKGYFAMMHEQSPDTGFYAFAQAVLMRGFEITGPDPSSVSAAPNPEYRHIYEIMTGGSAIADSLQSSRILKPHRQDRRPFIHISAVRGIEIPEHPWVKMMGNKKPDPEPLARLIPADNYYVRFKNFKKLNDFGDLLDQWGNNLLNAFDYKTRDYALRQRYERQLGVSGEWLRNVPPDQVKGIAITGSDPYLRDGSDVAVIFHVDDPDQLVKLQDQYMGKLSKELNVKMAHVLPGHYSYHVESYTAPLRVVSLHRIVLDNYVICANSPAGLKRIRDVYAGKEKALADALDFQYMRTCFRAEDKHEDGFGFLSDAFIRKLASPALRIKQARRAEAIAALQRVTYGAILAKTFTGNLPQRTGEMMRWDLLRANDAYISDQEQVEWMDNIAQSTTYGTIHFATPLIELPIDTISKSEYDEYEQFRESYLRLWRRFFDPVGLRFQQRGDKTVVEAYILPLVFSQDYEFLRNFGGMGPAKFDLSKMNSRTMLHMMMSLDNNFVTGVAKGSAFLRVDDDKLLREIIELVIEDERNGRSTELSPLIVQKILQLPIVTGVEGEVVKQVKGFLPLLKSYLQFEESQERYRGVTIEVRKVPKDHELIRYCNPANAKEVFQPTFCYAEIGEGLYFSLRKELIKELIDQYLDGKKKSPSEAPEVNAGIRINPKAAPDTREALYQYFEWQTHRKALMGNAAWQALHRSGLIPKGSTEAREMAIARQYFGYVPMSPDSTSYIYDSRLDEVVNRRHGSWRKPTLAPTLSVNAPLRQILDSAKGIQLELRFREDGVHTKVTLDKSK